MEFTLLWQALTGVAAAGAVVTLQRRRRLVDRELGLGDRLIGAAVVGMLVGRLTAMALQGVNPILNPRDILVVRGGVDTGAAAAAFLATLGWGLRRDLWRGLDAATPAALAGLAGWHAGCLFRGACLGAVSDLPWAMALPGSTLTRHPVELYAAGLYLLAAGGALWVGRRWPAGALAGAGLAAAAVIRLATQPLRPTIGVGPIGWYAAGVAVGLAVALVRYRSPRSSARPTMAPSAITESDPGSDPGSGRRL